MSEVGSRKYTAGKKVLDPGKVIGSNRAVDPQDLASCCVRMLRVSGRPSYIGTRMRCTVCDREAVVNDDGVWARGR